MGATGYIKAWRKVLESSTYHALTASQRDVFWACLLLANRSPTDWEWEGQVFNCNPGQFITSLDSLKKICAKDTSTQNIRTALKKLEKWQFLTNESTKTGRLITIVNWGSYQYLEEETNKANDKELTKSQQRANKELTPNKKIKKIKKIKKAEKNPRARENVWVKLSPPTLEEVKAYFKEKGYSEEVAEKAFEYYDEGDWIDGQGNKVYRWKQKMIAVWFKEENKATEETPKFKFFLQDDEKDANGNWI